MNSDGQMDQELRNLALLKPARSSWPKIERELNRRERRQRRRALMKYFLPAAAASVLVVGGLLVHRADDISRALEMQMTVENAVRDARPQAAFSNLNIAEGQRTNLEGLLVSGKQRPRGEYIGNPGNGLKPQAKPAKAEPINEF